MQQMIIKYTLALHIYKIYNVHTVNYSYPYKGGVIAILCA